MSKGLWIAAATAGLLVGRFGLADAQDKRPPMPRGEEGDEMRGHGPDGPGPNEGEEREVLDFLRDNNPDMARKLEDLREREPRVFRRKMMEIMPLYQDKDVRDTFVRGWKAEGKVKKLAETYRKADGKEKEPLRKELEDALGDVFDSKLAGHEIKLKRMSEELARQRERIAKRKSMKSQIVKKRLAEISGDVENWDW